MIKTRFALHPRRILCIKSGTDIVINKSEALRWQFNGFVIVGYTNQTKTIYLEIILSLFDVKMGPQYF
jgi:hypothetical protein